MPYDYALLDVFCDRAYAGNPLAIVEAADSLSGAQMQKIAEEFNLSETVFLLKPEKPEHLARMRIFTPKRELPFAGHPTIGTAIYLSQSRSDSLSNSAHQPDDAVIVLEEAIGAIRCAVSLHKDRIAHAQFQSPQIPIEIHEPIDPDQMAAALSLTSHDIGFENHIVSQFDIGLRFYFVPVRNLETLSRVMPDIRFWNNMPKHDNFVGLWAYCRQASSGIPAFSARMFSLIISGMEDPATGSAAACFSGPIHKFDQLPDGNQKIRIHQGVDMGRPSLIDLEIRVDDRQIKASYIGGNAIQIAKGVLF